MQARGERGSVLIWALLFVILTSGMVVAHTTFLAATRKEREARYGQRTLAATFARSGMVDAVSWFHRQPQQPVTTFDPVLEPEANPPRIDTMDPSIGLVREFEIHGNLWGRYELRHGEAVDISTQRGNLAPGTVWELGMRSYVYRVNDPSKAFNAAPNRLIATDRVTAEIRSGRLALPAPAALTLDDPSRLTIAAGVTVTGGDSAAVAFADATAVALLTNVDGAATLQGTPAAAAVTDYDAGAGTVFSMRLDELKSFADFVGDIHDSRMPSRGKLVFLDGPVVTQGLDLRRMVIVIDGDWSAEAGHAGRIDGVVYVTGSARIQTDMELNGALIVRGDLQLDRGVYRYDAALVDRVRKEMARYRRKRSKTPGS